MAIKDEPRVVNDLNASNFEIVFKRLPQTTFYCQQVMLPSYGLDDILVANPFNRLNYSDTQINIGRFAMRFKVDENMKNYVEILSWLKGLGFPDDFGEYIENKRVNGMDALRSDASLFIMTGSKNVNIEISLIDLFPVSVAPLDFDSTHQELQLVTCVAQFSIRDFKVQSINECDPYA